MKKWEIRPPLPQKPKETDRHLNLHGCLRSTRYLQVVKGSRDLLFEFWDPLYISGTVGAGNFKFGMHIDQQGY